MISHRQGFVGLLAATLVIAAGCNLNVNTPPVEGGSSASPGTSSSPRPSASVSPSGTTSPSPSTSASPAAGADTEPNDEFEQAQTLALATNLSASLGGTDETDTFMVAIPAGAQDGNLTITVTESSRDLTPYIRIYTSGKSEINGRGANDSTSSPTTFTENVTAGKSYYFQVDGGGTAVTNYTVRADFTPVADTHERNDTFETAKALTSGTTTDLYLFAGHETLDGSDEDYFTIQVPAGSTGVKVMIDNNSTSAEPQAHYVRIYNAAKEELNGAGASNNQADLDRTFEVEEAGTYYLKIDGANSPVASKLTVTVQ